MIDRTQKTQEVLDRIDRNEKVLGRAATSENLAALAEFNAEVSITHYRRGDADPDNPLLSGKQRASSRVVSPAARGGRTEVCIRGAGWKIDGVSYCSDLENFNRRLGITIALGRALKKMEEGRPWPHPARSW